MWCNILSLLLSVFALGISLFTYFKHDRKLKNQQEEINKFLIEKEKEAASLKMKADIRGNMIWKHKGPGELKIFNRGESEARNVKVEYLSSIKGVYIREIDVIESLSPQGSYTFVYNLDTGHVASIKVRYTWDDDFRRGNTREEILQVSAM